MDNKIGLYTGFGCAALLALYLKSASNNDLKNPTQDPDQDPITLLHVNLSLVTDASQIYDLISSEEVDVVSFQEYTPDWAQVIPPAMDSIYKYNYTDVRIDPYGKAIFSKSKMENIQIYSFDDVPNPIVEIKKNNISYKIFSTYIIPPLNNISKAKASQQLITLANAIALSNQNIIVVGEFNQVYWSADLVKLRTKTTLLNSRKYQEPTNQKMAYDQMFYSSPIECILFTDINDTNLVHIGCSGTFQIKHALNPN